MKNKLAVILNLVEKSDQLSPLTDHRPIASLPFASRYRIIDFIFSSMQSAELMSAALFISGSGHSLYDHVRSGSAWGLDSSIGGGIFTHSQIDLKINKEDAKEEIALYYDNHRKYIQKTTAQHILLTGSKILMNINLDSFRNHHIQAQHAITAAFKQIDPSMLNIDADLTAFDTQFEKPSTIQSVYSIGEESKQKPKIALDLNTLIVEKKFFLNYLDVAEAKEELISSKNLIQFAIEQATTINAFEYTGYCKVISDVPSYYQANMDMLEERKFNSLFYRNTPIITRTHHSSPSYYGPDSLVKQSLLASGSIVYGLIEKSVVFRNNFIGKNTQVTNSILMPGVNVGEGARIENAIIDKDVKIDGGVELIGRSDEPLIVKKGTHIHNY